MREQAAKIHIVRLLHLLALADVIEKTIFYLGG